MTHARTPIRFLPLALALASAMLAAAPAMAADPTPLRGPIGGHPVGSAGGLGAYVALRGGVSFADETSFEIGTDAGTGTVAGPIGVETRYDEGAFVAFAGGIRRGALRGELELSHVNYDVETHGMFVSNLGNAVVGQGAAQGEASALSLMASAYVDLPVGRFTPFAGVGVGVGHVRIEGFGVANAEAGGEATILLDDEGYGLAYHATLGAAYAVTDAIDLELAYRYQGIEAQVDSAFGQEIDVELNSHNVLAGVRIGF